MTWKDRSDQVIAQNCTTFSKRFDQYVHGPGFPTHITESDGKQVITDNGRRFFDLGGLGSQLLNTTNNYSLPHILEVAVCEAIKRRVPVMERIKVLKTGSAATEAAVRFARAHTGRSLVAWSGYHGTDNCWIHCEQPGLGTVDEPSRKFGTDRELLEYLNSGDISLNSLAAVCMEPVQLDDSDEQQQLVTAIIDAAHSNGALVILDEIITGWRVPDYTYTNHWHLDADIVTLGKALGNGFPISFCGGKGAIMNNPGVFISNTCNGEETSLKQVERVLRVMTPDKLNLLWDVSGLVQARFNSLAEKHGISLRLKGINTKWVWDGSEHDVALMQQELAQEGFLAGKAIHLKLNQCESGFNECGPTVAEQFVATAERIMEGFTGLTLRGTPGQPIFKRH